MVQRIFQFNEFWPLKLLSENLKVHWDSNSQSGAHLEECGLIPSHSLAFLRVWMWFPGCTFDLHLSNPYLGHEHKVKVATNGKVTISKQNSWAYAIDSSVTCDPCLSRIKICWLDWKFSPWTYFLKNDKNSLKKQMSSMPWFTLPYIYMPCTF
jgi:hypothetical protein